MRFFIVIIFLGLLSVVAAKSEDVEAQFLSEASQDALAPAVNHTYDTMANFAQMLYGHAGLEKTKKASQDKFDRQRCVSIAMLRMINDFIEVSPQTGDNSDGWVDSEKSKGEVCEGF